MTSLRGEEIAMDGQQFLDFYDLTKDCGEINIDESLAQAVPTTGGD